MRERGIGGEREGGRGRGREREGEKRGEKRECVRVWERDGRGF